MFSVLIFIDLSSSRVGCTSANGILSSTLASNGTYSVSSGIFQVYSEAQATFTLVSLRSSIQIFRRAARALSNVK